MCEMKSQLTISQLRPTVFIVNFEQILHTVPLFPLLSLSK